MYLTKATSERPPHIRPLEVRSVLFTLPASVGVDGVGGPHRGLHQNSSDDFSCVCQPFSTLVLCLFQTPAILNRAVSLLLCSALRCHLLRVKQAGTESRTSPKDNEHSYSFPARVTV